MKAARVLLKTVLGLIAVIVLLVALVFGIRAWNMSSWPDDILPDKPPAADGVTITEFSSDYARGYHLMPQQRSHPGSIVVFGGSEGSTNPYLASKLAKAGHEVYALNFFGQPGQREHLVRVPLELFDDVLPKLSKPITVAGTSKGAELVLVLSEHYPEIENVVAIAPTTHHWQGLDYNQNAPSFTWKGEDLPYVSLQNADGKEAFNVMVRMALAFPVAFRGTYDTALTNTPAADSEKARIKVENTNARYFLAAGEQDQVWDSAGAARQIKERIGDRAETHIYPDAGHAPGGPAEISYLNLGGTLEANQAMDKDMMEKLLTWLP